MIIYYEDVPLGLQSDIESVVITNSLLDICPAAFVVLADPSKIVTEGLRITGNEKIDLGFIENGNVIRLPFKLATATIAQDGPNNILRLGLLHEYGFKLVTSVLSSGYDNKTISYIISDCLQNMGIGASDRDVETVTTAISISPIDLNLGQEMLRIVAYEPKIGFLWHDLMDSEGRPKVRFKTWNSLCRQKPFIILSQREDKETIRMLDYTIELPNLWLRSQGESIDTYYLQLPNTIRQSSISYSPGSGLGEKLAWTLGYTRKSFIGSGNSAKHTEQVNSATARFLRRVHNSVRMVALVPGSLGWRPGDKVKIANLGLATAFESSTYGEWVVVSIEHRITAKQWFTQLFLTKTGFENVDDSSGLARA